MEKYYIPKIEELHSELECELFKQDGLGEPNTWCAWTISIHDFDGEQGCVFESTVDENKIRVKYLDQEDIESFGWKPIGSGWYERPLHRLRKWTDNELDIYEWHGEHDNVIIFRGKVKTSQNLKKYIINILI